MNFDAALKQWCNISLNSKILIVTDDVQLAIAEEIKEETNNICEIIKFQHYNDLMKNVKLLSENDLLIVLLSLDTYVKKGANRYFSPFNCPVDVVAKYIFLRLDISKESLLQGLSTPKKLVYDKISEMNKFNLERFLSVKNHSGTDITLKIDAFNTCSHEINNTCSHAFLPPSETSAEVIQNTANGMIVVDVTLGQLYYYGELLGEFGLVPSPITFIVENGLVTDVFGNLMAAELKSKLFELPIECREVVELGQGLSKMTPTGLIGVDESIIDTCHFGIGDGGKCGVHLDIVISNPVIRNVD